LVVVVNQDEFFAPASVLVDGDANGNGLSRLKKKAGI